MKLHWWPWPSIDYTKKVPSVRKKCLRNHVISPPGHLLMPNKLQNFNVQSFHMSFEMKIWGFHAYLLIHRCSGGGTVQSPVYGAPYKDFVWYCFFQKFFVKKWQTKHIFFFPFLDYWEHFLWNTTLFKQPSSSLRLCSGGFIKHEIERLWWCFTLY